MGNNIVTIQCENCRDERKIGESTFFNNLHSEVRCTCGGCYKVSSSIPNRIEEFTVAVCPSCNANLLPDDLQTYDEEYESYYCVYCNEEIPIESLSGELRDQVVEEFWKDEKEEEEDD